MPELLDYNNICFDRVYRRKEGIVSREQIQNLFDISDLDPKELSIYLGFNEDTILRYLEGKIPTKEDSDKLLKVIHNQEPINE